VAGFLPVFWEAQLFEVVLVADAAADWLVVPWAVAAWRVEDCCVVAVVAVDWSAGEEPAVAYLADLCVVD